MWRYPPQKNCFLLQFCELFFKKEISDRIPPFQKPISPFGDFSWKNKGLSNLVSVIYLGENLPDLRWYQTKINILPKKSFLMKTHQILRDFICGSLSSHLRLQTFVLMGTVYWDDGDLFSFVKFSHKEKIKFFKWPYFVGL
jgi:hypothetical protein